MQDGVRLRAEHYRDMAPHFRTLADVEPLASLRRHLQRLAAQHDEGGHGHGYAERRCDSRGGLSRRT
jgi:hypothetical protein